MSNSQEELEARIIAQAENDVMVDYGLTNKIDYLDGFSKTANYNEEVQDLYNYAYQQTLAKLANEETKQNGLSAEDIVNVITTQAEADAMSDVNIAEPADYMTQYGLSKSANWPKECIQLYEEVYNDSIETIVKSASIDPLLEQVKVLVGSITQDIYNVNLKKYASMMEENIAETVKNR